MRFVCTIVSYQLKFPLNTQPTRLSTTIVNTIQLLIGYSISVTNHVSRFFVRFSQDHFYKMHFLIQTVYALLTWFTWIFGAHIFHSEIKHTTFSLSLFWQVSNTWAIEISWFCWVWPTSVSFFEDAGVWIVLESLKSLVLLIYRFIYLYL